MLLVFFYVLFGSTFIRDSHDTFFEDIITCVISHDFHGSLSFSVFQPLPTLDLVERRGHPTNPPEAQSFQDVGPLFLREAIKQRSDAKGILAPFLVLNNTQAAHYSLTLISFSWEKHCYFAQCYEAIIQKRVRDAVNIL